MAIYEQLSVGRSGRLGKEERWMNERRGEEGHISSGTCMCYGYDNSDFILKTFKIKRISSVTLIREFSIQFALTQIFFFIYICLCIIS